MPRGILNHNPGNLRYSPRINWDGQVGFDEAGFAKFRGPQWGIRAGVKDILTGFRRDREDTIREIITEWAPPSENDTAAYISSVANRTGWDPDQVIVPDPENLAMLFTAIIQHENGQQPYADWLIMDGVTRALA